MSTTVKGSKIVPSVYLRKKKNEAVIRLLNKWLMDESGYDERTWPVVKKAIETNRLSSRKRFHD